MDKKEFIKIYNDNLNLIENYSINKAIKSISQLLQEVGLFNEQRQLESIGETYKYMIHYLLEGLHDKGRDSMLADMREKLYIINDKSLRAFEAKDNSDYYFEILRLNNYRKDHIGSILKKYGNIVSELSLAEAAGNDTFTLRKKREELLEILFNTLYTSLDEEKEYTELKNYLLSGYSDKIVASLSISALTLSLLQFYDGSKLSVMLDIFENTQDESISARSLIGIIFTLLFYGTRVMNNSKIKNRLYLWNDSIDIYRKLRETIRVIVGTRDTQRLADKMNEEVLPELMKLRPEILKSFREGNIDSGSYPMENNPEWEEILENSGLNDKMRELSEMQGEGADLLMVTFSNLKQFPFFNKASNWFIPFDINNTSLLLDEEMKKFVSFMVDCGVNVCDSDLYSLALASSQMPSLQRQMISSQMAAQFEQIKEEFKSNLQKSSIPQFDKEVLKNIRDIYRFFKLFRKRNGLKDPFAKPFNFLEIPVIGQMMQEDDVLRLIGEFYFKRGYYSDALPLLCKLAESEKDDSSLFEKCGFCYQTEGNFSKAKEFYEKASLLKTPGPWLTKKLAIVNRRLGNYSEAIEYYEKALDMDPENLSNIINLGNTMFESENLTGALQQFYHANYISPNNPKVLRAIAWLELLNGNFLKSSDYYKKIIELNAQSSDYLNAGHAEIMLGNIKEALNFYRLASNDNKNNFYKTFLEDLQTLSGLGLDRITALLVLDSI